MIRQEFKGTITVRCFCETCETEYMTEAPERGCPACEFKKKQEAKANKTKKGGGKND